MTTDVITRALCATFGYDPDVYDLETVRGSFKGMRIVGPAGPVQFLPDRQIEARLSDPAFVAALQQNYATAQGDIKQAKRARAVVQPAVDAAATVAMWLIAGWKLAAGKPLSGSGGG